MSCTQNDVQSWKFDEQYTALNEGIQQIYRFLLFYFPFFFAQFDIFKFSSERIPNVRLDQSSAT